MNRQRGVILALIFISACTAILLLASNETLLSPGLRLGVISNFVSFGSTKRALGIRRGRVVPINKPPYSKLIFESQEPPYVASRKKAEAREYAEKKREMEDEKRRSREESLRKKEELDKDVDRYKFEMDREYREKDREYSDRIRDESERKRVEDERLQQEENDKKRDGGSKNDDPIKKEGSSTNGGEEDNYYNKSEGYGDYYRDRTEPPSSRYSEHSRRDYNDRYDRRDYPREGSDRRQPPRDPYDKRSPYGPRAPAATRNRMKYPVKEDRTAIPHY